MTDTEISIPKDLEPSERCKTTIGVLMFQQYKNGLRNVSGAHQRSSLTTGAAQAHTGVIGIKSALSEADRQTLMGKLADAFSLGASHGTTVRSTDPADPCESEYRTCPTSV